MNNIEDLPKDLVEAVEKVIAEKAGDPIKFGKFQTSKEEFLKGHDLHYRDMKGKHMVVVYSKDQGEMIFVSGDGNPVHRKATEKQALDFFMSHSLSHFGNEYGEDVPNKKRN